MSDTDLDPTIAALLAEAENSRPQDIAPLEKEVEVSIDEIPSGHDEDEDEKDSMPGGVPDVDLSIRQFKPITKFFEDTPNTVFDDPAYYKSALTGEGDAAQRVHQVLSKYLTCQDPKDRTVYRQQLVTAYWELVRSVAPKMASFSIPQSKRMMLRFGVVLPSLFSAEQKLMFSKAIMNNDTGEPVYYLDEWFKEIASGRLTLSSTDEVRPAHKAGTGNESEEQKRLGQLTSKNDGKLQSSESFVNAKESERQMMETELKSRIDMLCEHPGYIGLEPHKMPYSEAQKKVFAEITDRLHALQKNDKELSGYLKEYEEARNISDSLSQKRSAGPEVIEV